jgi:hypothetical protein
MSYENNKLDVLSLFDNHIIKYVVKDLLVLDSIKADDLGLGGCSIPQAISTFSALDFIGYLIHTENIKTIGMSFTELLKNELYFPDFKDYSIHEKFFHSFRDDIRSVMVHRFSLIKYDIAKIKTSNLFIKGHDVEIFNVSYFTKMTINAINKIYDDIKNDTFKIDGFSKEASMENIKNKILNLKIHNSYKINLLENEPTSTISLETTRSLA